MYYVNRTFAVNKPRFLNESLIFFLSENIQVTIINSRKLRQYYINLIFLNTEFILMLDVFLGKEIDAKALIGVFGNNIL